MDRLILTEELRRLIWEYRRMVSYGSYRRKRRRLLCGYIPFTPWFLSSMDRRRLLAFRTVFYPPSYFTGRLGRYFRAHQGIARARATSGFLAACRRYHVLPQYIPLRRPFRTCQILRLAKRAGELYVREKVRSAHRNLIAKKLQPLIAKYSTPTDDAPENTTNTDKSTKKKKKKKKDKEVSTAVPVIEEETKEEYEIGSLWEGRLSTPIYPLPLSRNRTRRGRHFPPLTTYYGYLGKAPASPLELSELVVGQSLTEERLLTILDGVRQETRAREKQREELLRRIKQLQSRVHQRQEQGEENPNNHANPDYQNRCLRSLPQFARRADSAPVREMWRKRYLEAKKVTPRVEEECSRLRLELDKLHRELLAKVQAGVWALLTISGKTEKPSNKLSYKIMIARLLQEIEDLSRRVEGTRLKLHTEMKLRAMAEKDVRNLREELLKKKIQVTLTRNQEQAALGNGIRQQYFISAV